MQCFAPGNPKFPQFRGWSDPPVQAIESPARPKLVPVSRLAALYPVPPQPATVDPGLGCSAHGALACQLPPHRSQDSGLGSCSVKPTSRRRVVGAPAGHWDGTRGQGSARQGLVLAVGTSWTTAVGSAPRRANVSAYRYQSCRGASRCCLHAACIACWCLLCRKEFCSRHGSPDPGCGRRHGLKPPLPADGRFNILQSHTIYRRRADLSRQLSCRDGRPNQVDAQPARSEMEPTGHLRFCDSPRTPLQIEFRQQFPTGQGVRAGR